MSGTISAKMAPPISMQDDVHTSRTTYTGDKNNSQDMRDTKRKTKEGKGVEMDCQQTESSKLVSGVTMSVENGACGKSVIICY